MNNKKKYGAGRLNYTNDRRGAIRFVSPSQDDEIAGGNRRAVYQSQPDRVTDLLILRALLDDELKKICQ